MDLPYGVHPIRSFCQCKLDILKRLPDVVRRTDDAFNGTLCYTHVIYYSISPYMIIAFGDWIHT